MQPGFGGFRNVRASFFFLNRTAALGALIGVSTHKNLGGTTFLIRLSLDVAPSHQEPKTQSPSGPWPFGLTRPVSCS